jgi:hypothetical protein
MARIEARVVDHGIPVPALQGIELIVPVAD